jgi:hypothetical protein
MYSDVIYRNDELKWDLEQADHRAVHGWRAWTMRSRESQLLDSALAILGKALIAVGQWLAAGRGEPAVSSEPVASGQFGLTSGGLLAKTRAH